VNSTNPDELKKAKETLLAAKKNVKMFVSDTIDVLTNKEVIAAHAYSSDALQAAAKGVAKIEYIIPKEGGTFAIDNLVIVKGAKHTKAAHALINFLLTDKNEARKVLRIWSGPVLKGTKALLPADVQGNKALFPDAEVLKRLEKIRDLGAGNKGFEDVWMAVKTE
jgi:spermidine/putrescine transport system substrate-binding protein